MNAPAKIFSVKDAVGMLGSERREVQRLLTRMAPYCHTAVHERRARGLDFAALAHLHVLMRLRAAGLELARLEEESALLHQQVVSVIAGEGSSVHEFCQGDSCDMGTVADTLSRAGIRITIDLQESIDAVMRYVGVTQPVQRQLPMLVAIQTGGGRG